MATERICGYGIDVADFFRIMAVESLGLWGADLAYLIRGLAFHALSLGRSTSHTLLHCAFLRMYLVRASGDLHDHPLDDLKSFMLCIHGFHCLILLETLPKPPSSQRSRKRVLLSSEEWNVQG